MMKKSKFFLFLTLIFSCFSIFNTTIIIKNKRKDQMISAVSGYTIFIDPGHGGKDNGASFNDVLEDEINLSIATKVYEMLIDLGARTLISRVDDYDLGDAYAKNHKIQDLKKRIAYMKENQADLFVSIHLNSFSNSDVSGAQVFYKKNVPSSEEFALVMQQTFNSINKKEKKPKVGDYYLLNNSGDLNGVMVECGFLSNTEERNQLITDAYQEKIASLIKDGILAYLEAKNRI